MDSGFLAVSEILGKVWIYILLGICVGAFIHFYVPVNFMAFFL